VSEGERLACWTGAILLGFGAWVMLWRKENNPRRDEPVEVLAEELKEAWAEYHTP
jgi:hypothetical protein